MPQTFDSALEARAASVLAPHGFVRVADAIPLTFYDPEGCRFEARADFRHQPTGLLIELKDSFLNETGTKARADRKRRGWRGTNARYEQLQCGWNHSYVKLSTVQLGVAEAGGALVALFWNEPDADTISRMRRRGTFWVVHGSPGWVNLLRFLTIRSNGVPIRLEYSVGDVAVHRFQ